MKYPYLVTRAIPGFYLNTNINFVKDPTSISNKSSGITVHWEKVVYDSDGKISDDCRTALQSIAAERSQKFKLRVCLVYSESDCDYLEPNGTISVSTQPPSATLRLADGEYQSNFKTEKGKIKVDLTHVKNAENKPEKRKRSLKQDNLLGILLLVFSMFLSGCGISTGSAESRTRGRQLPVPIPPKCVQSNEAKSQIGRTTCISGKVANVTYINRIKGKPTFINFDKPYPNQSLTIVIWGADRSKFGDLKALEGKEIEVKGQVEKYSATPQIIVTELDQILNSGLIPPDPSKKKKVQKKGKAPGSTARCNDGWISYSSSRKGTCSHHGGVAVWF